jgi:hypothetical protein
MPTNFNELEAHLKQVFDNIFRTESFQKEASFIGEKMRKNVFTAMDRSSHDYNQSGNLRHILRTTDDGFYVTKTRTVIGFGGIDDLNAFTKRQGQRAVFFDGTNYRKEIRLRAEPSLPSWIIAEFGRKAGSGTSTGEVPSEFLVAYKTREDKQYLFGPSDSRHFRKRIYFMASRKMFKRAFPSEPVDNFRQHPGVTAGHIFSKGLEISIPDINDSFSKAINNSLDELGR